MKRVTFTLLAFSFLVFSASAKIWRVNNNQGVNADFTTLSAAHDGAVAGDTIHLEASPNSYGGATFTKKLVVFGPGYYLDQNPNTQAAKQTAIVSSITLYAGASGSVIAGLDFGNGSISVYASDVTIRRNKFAQAYGSNFDYYTGSVNTYTNYQGNNAPVSNIIISQNFGLRIIVNNPSPDILISNNYLSYYSYAGDGTTGDVLYLNANATGIIQNNIIRRGKVTINNSTITNNIMMAGTFSGTGNLVSNNLANASQFGTDNNNKANVDMATVFLGAGTDISYDSQWKLASASPAIGAGYGSTAQNPIDAGMYGGHTPYILSGLPAIPSIYYFENKPVGSNGDPITVTIKVKSNN